MSATLDRSIEVVLKHEGGVTTDHAGLTSFGVTLVGIIDMGDFDGDGLLDFDLNFDGLLDSRDIALMSNEDAVRFYRQLFEKWGFDSMPGGSATVKYFDIAVNMGMKQATRTVQRALYACGQNLNIDGSFGPETRSRLERVAPIQDGGYLIPPVRSEAAGFYRFLVGRNPDEYKKYLNGWLNRAYD